MTLDYLSGGSDEEDQKLLGFLLGDVLYGIDIMQVREIVNPGELINIPHVPSFVIGVAYHRNAVVPIIDLGNRFGLEKRVTTTRIKWILVKTPTKDVGLEVDRVTEVVKVSEKQLRERHSLMDNEEIPWIRKVFSSKNGLIFQIDLETVIGSAAELPEDQESKGHDQASESGGGQRP